MTATEHTQCPYCHSECIKRDGVTVKGAQRFFCFNCRRYWQDTYVRKKINNRKEPLGLDKINSIFSIYLFVILNRDTCDKTKNVIARE